MSSAITTELDLEPPEPDRARASRREQHRPSRRPLPHPRLAVHHAGLPVVVALSAVLNFHRLAQNGYANVFYAAGVQSMLHSLHNFLFVSFDPGGLVSVDKPPIALWVQVASAKLLGFSPMHLLAPEALAGVASVALLYVVLAKRFGVLAALAGSLTLAVFPSFVAVSRDNGVDPVLLLLLTCACAAAVRACDSGRLRTLLAAGVLVGLAFNTKTLAAYLAVPGIALAYLVCAPVPMRRRIVQLALAGAAMLVVSFAWIFYVDSVPASKRPYVGSSTNNSELGLTFGYNGLGRVEGQEGGPNSVITKPGAYVPARQEQHSDAASAAARAHGALPAPAVPSERVPKGAPASPPIAVKGRAKEPTPFGPSPRPLRLFGSGLGDQAGWMLPFALFGLLASIALALAQYRSRRSPPAPARRRVWPAAERSQLAFALAFGGWFAVELVVLSLSKGIIHPYYVSGLAPGTGAMAGVGVAAFVKLARRPHPASRLLGLTLVAVALATTVLAQVVLMQREHYMQWFVPLLVAGAAIGMFALAALRRLAAPAVACTLALLLITPGAYAASTWLAPVEGTFPVAGPKSYPGPGGYGVNARDLALNRAILDWVSTHHPGTRWELLTVASDTAAPMMLMGLKAGALGGYSGTDKALGGPGLAHYVARGEARYVLLGGGYSLRGGNGATKAVLRACRELPPWEWHSPVAYPFGLVLFDCAGRARQLAAS
jgi:4-amino-4-deoxy-L-arabinose transferase-like glycosyltransferase